MAEEIKKQQRKEASKHLDNKRRQNRRNKESYGFTMDMLICPEDVDKLRQAVKTKRGK